MQNINRVKILVINKTILLIKAIINKKRSDISI